MSKKNRLESVLERTFHAPLAPHPCRLSDPSDWESVARKVFQRHLHSGEYLDRVCRDIKVDFGAATQLLGFVRAHACGSTGKRLYHRSSVSKQLIPPLLCEDWAELRADRIGHEIYRVARSKDRAEFVRQVMTVYALATNKDKQIVLSSPESLDDLSDPDYARALGYAQSLGEFVRFLGLEDLRVGLIAFDRSPQGWSRLEKLRDQLRLPKDTPLHCHAARNAKAASSKLQIGLEVVRRVESRDYEVDGAFFATMVLGAVVEAWRFAVPAIEESAEGQVSATAAQQHRPPTDLPGAMLFTPAFWRGSSFMEPPPLEKRAEWERRRALLERSNPDKPVRSWHLSDISFDLSYRTKH